MIENCLEYDGRHNNTPNYCKKCTNDTYLFNLKTYCIDVTPIIKCRIYKNNTLPSECIECEDGSYLESPQSCITF